MKSEPLVYYVWGLFNERTKDISFLLSDSQQGTYRTHVESEHMGTGWTGKSLALAGWTPRRFRIEVLP